MLRIFGTRRMAVIAVCITAAMTPVVAADTSEEVIEATLNGLQITLDAKTGGVVGLSSGETKMLDAVGGGIVDIAYPIEQFHALRLAPRFGQDAKITQSDKAVTIEWSHLPASRDLPVPGEVKVAVTLAAADDGKSVAMKCRVDNNTTQPIRQILFPDLSGLLPFGGEQQTQLRLGGAVVNPFTILKRNPAAAPFYAEDPVLSGRFFNYRNAYHPHLMRWMDFGDLKNGFSLWQRAWGWDPLWGVWVRRDETDGKVRLACVHNVNVATNNSWESGEYLITPHSHGWAEGIEPFRKWVQQNLTRPVAIPDHVRDGLGFRSIFMTRGMPPNTAEDVVYKIEDMVQVATEAKAHGLDEMSPWFWCPYFQLPFQTLPLLGTDESFAAAIQDCRKAGVNVSPFISCFILSSPSADRYGLKVIKRTSFSGWTYHHEMIPMFNPGYTDAHETIQVNQDDVQWQDDVFKNWSKMNDLGVPSLVWDVYGYGYQPAKITPSVYDLTQRIREAAIQKDPQAVFAAESCSNLELEAAQIDYTWNWMTWDDRRAFSSAFPAPRLNININQDPSAVWRGFMDNYYLNVMPNRPGDINGSAKIADYPEVSQALKQCAKLRKQFLPYFVEGTMIGECALAEPSPHAYVTAYVLPKKMLLIAYSVGHEEMLSLKADLQPWLSSTSEYEVKQYDLEGNLEKTAKTSSDWQTTTESPGQGKILIYEFVAP